MNIIIYLCHLWFDLPNNYLDWHTGSMAVSPGAMLPKATATARPSVVVQKVNNPGLRSLHA